MTTAQAFCSCDIRAGFSAALARVLPAAGSAMAAAPTILTKGIVRQLSRGDESGYCTRVTLDEVSENIW